MAYKYPFKTGEELKEAASQINLDYSIDNIQSSFALAANDLKDVVSENVWDLMIGWYNNASYNPAGTDFKDKLVQHFLAPTANLALFHHFIWLQLQISNSGVTVVKNDNETSAFKYQTDEAKDKLLQSAWAEVNNLITFLNADATAWTNWAATTAYITDQIVRYESKFYKCTADHTSTDTFDATKFTLEADADVILHEWTLSDQYTEQKELVFDSYKDFDNYFSIDRNASFYIRLRYILIELITEEIKPRIKDPYTITDAVLLIKVKRFLAYMAMSLATFRFDILNLPFSTRQAINNSMTKKGDDLQFIKEKLSISLKNKANDYLKELDMYQSGKEEPADGTSPYADYEKEFDEDDKHVSVV